MENFELNFPIANSTPIATPIKKTKAMKEKGKSREEVFFRHLDSRQIPEDKVSNQEMNARLPKIHKRASIEILEF
ncbi:Protein CBG26500 [Caenorhabditis briggsae]|uniref:Protein CBG26500 n=1 Tax=Caenorhabditis briggsae TaxID=6238 RepID=B6ILB7_CAEBR|nr:Protein CBG26500 [Caenorhabditis briggsae]CAS00697.1 Protein CBG26500 [Caenorhabditis briggsae]